MTLAARLMARLAPLALAALVACGPATPGDPSDAGAEEDTSASSLLSDPLSMPAKAAFDHSAVASAEACAMCHPNQVAEWQESAHAYAMDDPVFRALVALRHADEGGANDRFCVQCHSSVASRTGVIADQLADDAAFEALPSVAHEGVTCVACHQVTEVAREHNAGHVLDPSAPMGGQLADPAPSAFHASETRPLLGESRLCGSCHDVVETTGVPIERPFSEWLESPAADGGPTCQSCHMPTYNGQAADGGPERAGLRRHRFVGVDVPRAATLDPEALAARVAEVDALLGEAATLSLAVTSTVRAGTQLDLALTVENRIDGHNLPTGTTFIRQCWLHVVVRDATGAVLYETGDLDANGDLRDAFSAVDPYGDDELMRLGSALIDARGDPTIFTWQASEHVASTLPPHHKRTWVRWLQIPQDATGPLAVEATLRFRPMPPYLLAALGLDGAIAHTRVHDMASDAASVVVTPSDARAP